MMNDMSDEEMIEKWLDKRMLRPKKYEPVEISEILLQHIVIRN